MLVVLLALAHSTVGVKPAGFLRGM